MTSSPLTACRCAHLAGQRDAEGLRAEHPLARQRQQRRVHCTHTRPGQGGGGAAVQLQWALANRAAHVRAAPCVQSRIAQKPPLPSCRPGSPSTERHLSICSPQPTRDGELHGQLRRDDGGEDHDAVQDELEAVAVGVLPGQQGSAGRRKAMCFAEAAHTVGGTVPCALARLCQLPGEPPLASPLAVQQQPWPCPSHPSSPYHTTNNPKLNTHTPARSPALSPRILPPNPPAGRGRARSRWRRWPR